MPDPAAEDAADSLPGDCLHTSAGAVPRSGVAGGLVPLPAVSHPRARQPPAAYPGRSGSPTPPTRAGSAAGAVTEPAPTGSGGRTPLSTEEKPDAGPQSSNPPSPDAVDYSLVLVQDASDDDADELAGWLLAGSDGPPVAGADSTGPTATGAAAHLTKLPPLAAAAEAAHALAARSSLSPFATRWSPFSSSVSFTDLQAAAEVLSEPSPFDAAVTGKTGAVSGKAVVVRGHGRRRRSAHPGPPPRAERVPSPRHTSVRKNRWACHATRATVVRGTEPTCCAPENSIEQAKSQHRRCHHVARPSSRVDTEGFTLVESRRRWRHRKPERVSHHHPVPQSLVGLCFNYLGGGHVTADCRSPSRCLQCRCAGHRARDCKRSSSPACPVARGRGSPRRHLSRRPPPALWSHASISVVAPTTTMARSMTHSWGSMSSSVTLLACCFKLPVHGPLDTDRGGAGICCC